MGQQNAQLKMFCSPDHLILVGGCAECVPVSQFQREVISKEDKARPLGKLYFLTEKKKKRKEKEADSAGMSPLPFTLPVAFANIMT